MSRRGVVLLQVGLPVLLGLIAAVLQSTLKLRLGIPGHAALLWLTPLLLARCLSPLAGAGSLSSTSLATGMYAFGGLSPRFPLVPTFGSFWLVGPVLDICAGLVRRFTGRSVGARLNLAVIVVVAVGGVVGNLAQLALKVGFGAIGPHAPLLGLPAGLYEAVTHAAFGLAAGVLACGLAWITLRRG